ncbi:uncharacterized protein [Linepithema humile]|uniref:uncharacterized protein n=1 Tax=Linepithema humile TaxID=83485 RepID=UPI00351F59DC
MDFQSVNPINIRLNLISGNLLPMTADDSSYPTFWKIYSALVWLLELVQTCVLIPGCIMTPKEKALKDGLIGIVVTIEVLSFFIRIYMRKELVLKLIRKLDDILHIQDEMMKSIVMATLQPMDIPLKFYWTAGVMSIFLWGIGPFPLIFEKNTFFYVEYRMPVVYSKEPISTSVFVLGNVIVMLSSMYIFTKKVGVDSYMIHMILLITAQYRYIALKLSMIFQDFKILENNQNNFNEKEYYNETNYKAEKKIKSLCRHFNAVINISLMLRELLSVNLSIIYVNSIFRFCCIFIMLISIPAVSWLDRIVTIMYASGGVVQLFILTSCVQQLLDASVEITDQAFHEEWYRYGTSIKSTFMFMIMVNNMGLKISKFEKYSMSRTSFMTILNQSYSIALLLFT